MRKRDPGASREAILASTLELLRTKGIQAVTTERIARGANCAKGLVNYHFTSRDALLREAATRAAEHLLQPRLAAMSAAGAAVVDNSWKALRAQATDGTMIMWASVESLGTHDGVGAAVGEAKSRIAVDWDGAVEEWLNRSGFQEAPASDVSRASWAILDGFGLALLHEDADVIYPAYLTAWLGLIGELMRA